VCVCVCVCVSHRIMFYFYYFKCKYRKFVVLGVMVVRVGGSNILYSLCSIKIIMSMESPHKTWKLTYNSNL